MRPVYFYGAVSLDGYLADEKDDLQWLFNTDLAGQSTFEGFEKLFDTMVMGRVTFEETVKMLNGAPFYPEKQKVILSRTRSGDDFVNEDPVTAVKKLKQQSGKGIWIVGGGGVVTDLMKADLIDEYWIQIAPVLLGEGKRLFEPGDYQKRFTVADTTRLGQLTEMHLKRAEA